MGNNVLQIGFLIIFIQLVSTYHIQTGSLLDTKWRQQSESIPNVREEIKDDTSLNYSSNLDLKTGSLEIVNKLEYINITKEKPHVPIKHRQIRLRYIPFSPINNSDENTCVADSTDDFPEDIFTYEERRRGALVVHFIFGVYCFTLLALVCNDYFLPSVERICEFMQLSEDVAAATFMAIATSAPEFFVNVVGTFITESDIGVGTVVGSAMFNTLGVAAVGGLAASKPIQLHWWPLTRDSIIYVIVVSVLVAMCHDDKIAWYEAAILLIMYILYFVLMFANGRIKGQVKKVVSRVRRNRPTTILSSERSSTGTTNEIPDIAVISTNDTVSNIEEITTEKCIDDEKTDSVFSQLCSMPEGCFWKKAFYIYSWPIKLLLVCTIPDCKKYPKIYPLTFLMCVAWIGSNSYLVSWMITIIGNTIGVPDFVMGLTFLAAGGCLPEAISIFLVCRKGKGGMGVSNSLGANTLDILLCLGLPWFIKTMVTNQEPIRLTSGSLFYTIIALILAVFTLYGVLYASKYKLNRKNGLLLIIIYFIFLAVAITLEIVWLNKANIPPCLD